MEKTDREGEDVSTGKATKQTYTSKLDVPVTSIENMLQNYLVGKCWG